MHLSFGIFGAREVLVYELFERVGAVFFLGEQVAQFFVVVFKDMHVKSDFTNALIFGYNVD